MKSYFLFIICRHIFIEWSYLRIFKNEICKMRHYCSNKCQWWWWFTCCYHIKYAVYPALFFHKRGLKICSINHLLKWNLGMPSLCHPELKSISVSNFNDIGQKSTKILLFLKGRLVGQSAFVFSVEISDSNPYESMWFPFKKSNQ